MMSKCDGCGETVADIDAGFSPGLHAMSHECGGVWRPAQQGPQTVAVEACPSEPLAVPKIHPNGSGRVRLAAQLEAAHQALERALEAMAEGAPHGRDYYVQAPGALERAQLQHKHRLLLVTGVQNELAALWEGLGDL